MQQLRDSQKCYVCGDKNPAGLAVNFIIDKGEKSIRAAFIPSDNHQSFEGIVHGGIISALLDEAMGKLAFTLGIPAMTAEMTVRFKASSAPGEELFITGRIIEESKRLVRAEARIQRGPIVIAEAEGKLLRTGSNHKL